jgi:hypothetical protein
MGGRGISEKFSSDVSLARPFALHRLFQAHQRLFQGISHGTFGGFGVRRT